MEVIKLLQSISNPILDNIFINITMMGEETFLILIITFIFWCIDKRLGYRLGFIILSGIMFNGILKLVFHTARPIGTEGIRSLRQETATGYSFPSGHVQVTATLWTTIYLKFKKKWVFIIGIIITILIGVSRLYLGVHWPIDVIFGTIFGIAWAIGINKLIDFGGKKIINYILIPATLLIFLFGGADSIRIGAMLAGAFVGYVVEGEFIKFEAKTTMVNVLIRYIVGIGVILILQLGIRSILSGNIISNFLYYFSIGIWITAGAPLIFKNYLS